MNFHLAFVASGALLLSSCGITNVTPERSDGGAGATEIVAPTLFVANKRGNTLSKIDLATGKEVLRIDSCANPHELATSPDGRHVALACYGGTTVDIFDVKSLKRVESVALQDDESSDGNFVVYPSNSTDARPHGIVWHKSGTIYVTAEARQSIFSLKDPVRGPIGVTEYKTNQQGSHMLAVAPDESAAWTTDLGSKTVTRIDLAGDAKPLSVTVGDEPEGIALAPDGKTLWVSARGSDEVLLLDPKTMAVRKSLKAGSFPLRLIISPDGRHAVTSDLGNGGLTVYDTVSAEPVRYIMVGGPEKAQERLQVTILWSDDGERIYVAETGSDTVAEVDFASGNLLRRLKTGEGGDGMAIVSPVEELLKP